MRSPPAETGLTFDWPDRDRFPFILFGCVFLSLIIHTGTFFVFQVVYPQRVTIPPPAPLVSLLTASSPENEALLRWIAAEDPALVASARSVVPAGLLAVPYRPSFAIRRAQPLGSVEPAAPIQFPPPRTPLSIIASAAPVAVAPPAAPLPMRTTLQLSPTLEERGMKPPGFHWTQPALQPLHPLRALIAVNERGEVRFAFLQRSSGDAGIDTETLQQLQGLRFSLAEAPLTWATATIEFGAEAYASAPAELRRRP